MSSTLGLIDEDGLEAALQRAVFLDVLAVFVQGRGADAAQLAARQQRFEQVGGVHGAFGRARAHHRVQLVDEQNDFALGFLNFFEHGFEPLFEFAAVFRAGDQRAHVQGNELFVLEALRHVAADDALRQAFDDGGFSHARIADQHGIIFAAPGQHLDHAANFFVAADHRIELALGGELGEVAAIFAESFIGRFRILRRHPLVAADLFERLPPIFRA